MAIDMKYKKWLELDVFKQMRKAPRIFSVIIRKSGSCKR